MQPQQTRGTFDIRALLESTGTPFHVARHEQHATIFVQRDACDTVMHIEKGRVRLAVTAPSGQEAIVGLLGAGAFLGEEAMAGHAIRRQTATAMTSTELLVIAKAQMIRLLRTHLPTADRFIAYEIARHLRLEANLVDQLLYSGERRLAHMLLELSGCDPRRPRKCALPAVSQETLAEMIGTTRSRVNLFLGKFKKLGFIEQSGRVLQIRPALQHVLDDSATGA